jgi:hypothetical protein
MPVLSGEEMNITQGQFHKPTLEDRIILCLQWAICFLVIFIIAMFAVDALIIEDDARISKLNQHLYDIALRHDPVPAGPPQPTDKAVPKTRMFQDSSQPKGK